MRKQKAKSVVEAVLASAPSTSQYKEDVLNDSTYKAFLRGLAKRR